MKLGTRHMLSLFVSPCLSLLPSLAHIDCVWEAKGVGLKYTVPYVKKLLKPSQLSAGSVFSAQWTHLSILVSSALLTTSLRWDLFPVPQLLCHVDTAERQAYCLDCPPPVECGSGASTGSEILFLQQQHRRPGLVGPAF